MKWDDFDSDLNVSFAASGQLLTDIECLICGKKVYWDSRAVLTSFYHNIVTGVTADGVKLLIE